MRLRALIVEDSYSDALLMLRELKRAGYDVEHTRVDNAEDMLSALESGSWDVILSDFSMPNFSASAALELVKDHGIDTPFIIVSGTMGEETAVMAMKAGAHDYFPKGRIARLGAAIDREMRDARERQQRKQAEEELRQAEERFAKAFQVSPIGMSINSGEGFFLSVNDSFRAMLGLSSEGIIGRTALELRILTDPSDQRLLQAAWGEHEAVQDAEIVLRTQAGEARHVSVSTESIDLGGEVCVLTMWQNITERKKAERALQRSTALTQLLQEVTVAANRATEVDTTLEFAMDRICRFAGWVVGSAVMRPWGQPPRLAPPVLWHIDSLKKFDRKEFIGTSGGLVDRIIASGEPEWIDDPASLPAGLRETGMKSVYGFPVFAHQDVTAVMQFFSMKAAAPDKLLLHTIPHIITQVAHTIERVRANEEINRYAAQLELRVDERTAELRQSKERLEAILHNSSDAIILTDGSGTIQQTNPRFNELFGYDYDELFGVHLTGIFALENTSTTSQILDAITTDGEYRRIEVLAKRKDGSEFPADAAFAAFSHRQEMSIVCSLRDISEQKFLEQELRSAYEQQKELADLKTRFISTVSHEYRTPLTVIQTSTSILQDYDDRLTDDQRHSHLERIRSQVDRLTDLLGDVLVISKADTLGVEFHPEWLDMDHLCQEIVDDFRHIAPGYQIKFRVLGEVSPTFADEKLVHQVVTNLVSNAIKYSPGGGQVEIELIFEDTATTLIVKDTGMGIPQEDLGNLFTTFHRARNVGQIQGTGLGLAIVKQAVEAHGGSISVKSAVGEGTTFTVRLP